MGRVQTVDTMDRVAIVTGGARGIGSAAALRLARAGHPVCINDTGVAVDGRDPSPLPAQELAAELRATGGRAMASAVDCRSPATANALVAEVGEWAGTAPTVLVHAAGILRDRMVHKSTDDDWSEVLGAHLGVAVELTRAMAPSMRSGRWGRVVYVGGAAGLIGNVGQSAYAVAKAGLLGLTRSVALEMAGRDVCVNYVAPFAFTRMTETVPPVTDRLTEYLGWARLTSSHDVAPLLAWLCSDAASAVTGQILGVRGAELSVWSQPRPLATVAEPGGWDETRLTARMPELRRHLTALESEFDVFSTPPVAVAESGGA